ncbi:hypothetical protein [Deinococcus rubellus]|uniref:hypothetical protein n=1 Tax=Deinococcus rubellus TaxID=1889240 RepID=UPI0031E5CE97
MPDVPLWLSWVWLPAKPGQTLQQRFIVSTAARSGNTIKRTGKRRGKIDWTLFPLVSRN